MVTYSNVYQWLARQGGEASSGCPNVWMMRRWKEALGEAVVQDVEERFLPAAADGSSGMSVPDAAEVPAAVFELQQKQLLEYEDGVQQQVPRPSPTSPMHAITAAGLHATLSSCSPRPWRCCTRVAMVMC